MTGDLGSTPDQWLLQAPLYKPLASGDDLEKAAHTILFWRGTVDAWCPGCGGTATLRGEVDEEKSRQKKLRAASTGFSNAGFTSPYWMTPFWKELRCTRQGHLFRFYFEFVGDNLIKVGQFPSLADIVADDSATVARAIGAERGRAFNTAIGLAAHGVGAGSVVYLRRIFESLVEEAHEVARGQDGWDESAYINERMRGRIRMLRAYLPDFVSDAPQLYGHLSSGVHELSDEECNALFPVLRTAIVVIAEERLEAKSRKSRAARVRELLANPSRVTGQG